MGTQWNDSEIEAMLLWPAGTLAVLRAAFASSRGRDQAWDVRALSPEERARHLAAARVYKRGVSVLTDDAPDGADTVAESWRYRRVPVHFCDEDVALTHIAAAPFVIMDAGFAVHWPSLRQVVAADAVLELNESRKNLASVAEILTRWRAYGMPRTWLIVGGGVLSDTAMFAASLVGAEVDLLPTTLLAMVDAAIGGKTGVNFAPYGKNQVGAFYLPRAIWVCAEWLKTLPAMEFAGGGAECLKHALLAGDAALLACLPEVIAQRDVSAMAPLLKSMMAYKEALVERDPREHGCRAWLNFGHTIGHALESVSQERAGSDVQLRHGEAVAFGLSFETYLARALDYMEPLEEKSVQDLLQRSAIMPSLIRLREALAGELDDPALWAALVRYLRTDKKNTLGLHNMTQWTLLSARGKPLVDTDKYTVSVALADVERVWTTYVRDFC